jgi:hypothetical protein
LEAVFSTVRQLELSVGWECERVTILCQMWEGHQPGRTSCWTRKLRNLRCCGSHYQAMTSEDTADWEDLLCAVVNWWVCVNSW